MTTIIVLYIASLVVNFLMFHFQSKKDGFSNPIGLLMVFMFFFGTAVLGLIYLFEILDEFYSKSR